MTPVSTSDHGDVLVITVQRPEARNAINQEMARMIDAALRRLDAEEQLSVGILTGSGGVFSAGMDLKEFLNTGRPPLVDDRGFAGLTRATIRKPLIAAVDGWALGGGCELALACDLIVASESARFGLPEVSRGLIAAEGGIIRLPQRLPYHLAMEMILTGEPLGAQRAAQCGLVNRLVPVGESVVTAALTLAHRIARNGPLALAAAKQVIRTAYGEVEAFAAQDRIAATLAESSDAAEGARAFLERREPQWSSR